MADDLALLIRNLSASYEEVQKIADTYRAALVRLHVMAGTQWRNGHDARPAKPKPSWPDRRSNRELILAMAGVITAERASKATGLAIPSVYAILAKFCGEGDLRRVTAGKYVSARRPRKIS